MTLKALSNEEIRIIAEPILDNILDGARTSNYEMFSRDFHVDFAVMINEQEFNRQQSHGKKHGHVKPGREFLKCLRNEHCVMVLWIGQFENLEGEILIGLNLREINNDIKVVGIWHHH